MHRNFRAFSRKTSIRTKLRVNFYRTFEFMSKVREKQIRSPSARKFVRTEISTNEVTLKEQAMG